MGKKIFIYSIPRPTATNVSEFKDGTSGKPLNKTKIGKCADGIQALYKPSVGGLANGLSYKPWMDPETGKQKIDPVTNRLLTLQDQMEQKWNLTPGYLTNRPFRKGDSLDPSKMTYYQTQRWKMQDGCTVLDLDNMEDELAYYVMLDSKYVANSEKEWRSHKWPSAMWYIALENESDEIKYARSQAKNAAITALHTMDEDTRRKFVTILKISKTQNNLTPIQIYNALHQFVELAPSADSDNVNRFNTLYTLTKNASGKERLQAMYIIQQGLDTQVLYEKQNSYFFKSPTGPINIGDRYDDAIDFILSPKKDKEVKEITDAIKERL